ncbi:hypothetical protein DU478_21410 [Thalassococcus profundi]|uniref:Uncharacterized protein n=1 Tax=Thalassococcus profundi TaxID=2282382 RepID=A0A369TFQ1_9RHOB|nr:hypothetical protein DU478_21410 [Thalassococcus profundi]
MQLARRVRFARPYRYGEFKFPYVFSLSNSTYSLPDDPILSAGLRTTFEQQRYIAIVFHALCPSLLIVAGQSNADLVQRSDEQEKARLELSSLLNDPLQCVGAAERCGDNCVVSIFPKSTCMPHNSLRAAITQ